MGLEFSTLINIKNKSARNNMEGNALEMSGSGCRQEAALVNKVINLCITHNPENLLTG